MSFGLHPFGLAPFGASAATGAAPPGDTEAPTWVGPITVGTKTDTTIALTLPTAADNVGVTAYEYRVNGGAWINNAGSTAVALSGLAALTSYTIDARAKDAAGNVSTTLSVTTSTYRAGATGQYILDNTGPVGSSLAGILYDDVSPGDEAKWFSFTIVAPPASGTLSINPDGTFTFTGPSSTFFTYQLEVDGVSTGAPQTVSLYGTTVDVTVSGQGGTMKAGTGAVSVDLLALPVTVAAAGTGVTSKTGAGSVSVDVLALAPVVVSAAAAGATLKSGAGAVSVDLIAVPPGTVTVQASGSGATVKAGAGGVSVTVLSVLPVITVAAQGQGATIKSGSGGVFITDGSIVWPVTRAGEANTARVPFDGVRVIVPDADDPAAPVKVIPLYVADTERILVDWEAKYLYGAGDTAATVLALDVPAGVSVTPSVAPGAALTTGVVVLAVTPTGAAGTYRVALRIGTVGGRESTALVDVVVSATVASAKTFRLRSTADRDVFDLDFAAKYLAGAADVADVLLATSADAGLTADARLVFGGVVQVAVDNPDAPGAYQVRTQLQTAAGRRKTGAISVEVLA